MAGCGFGGVAAQCLTQDVQGDGDARLPLCVAARGRVPPRVPPGHVPDLQLQLPAPAVPRIPVCHGAHPRTRDSPPPPP